MLKLLRLIVLALVALCLITFALANRELAPVRLLPDDLAALLGMQMILAVPVWMVLFTGLLAGLVLGIVWEWTRERTHRTAARTGRREVARLEREMAVMKDSSGVPQDEILALIDKPKAR